MSESPAPPSALSGWLQSTFPDHPYHAIGVSGAALLYELLRREPRGTLILPAFTSYTLSGAATAAGKRVLHIDADPATLHMRTDLLDQAIVSAGAENSIVLIDHTCGHPFPGIAALRQRHPEVRIVEDCVRALGGTSGGAPLGSEGDWTLLSLYKTTAGNLNGAILLSRTPLDLPVEAPHPVRLKQRVAGIRAVRRLHQRFKGGPFSAPNRERGALIWSPKRGAPNALCLQRFEHWLRYLPQRVEAQRSAAASIEEGLRDLPGLTPIEEAPDCESAAHFVSFTVSQGGDRNAFLAEMHRRGCALERTWHVVPSFYRGFAATFPFGSAGSEFLADHVIHIPVADYLDARRLERLIAALREVAHNPRLTGISGA